MTSDQRRRALRNGSRDPWANAPTSELGDQVLPRWFVLTAIAAVAAAAVVAVAALVMAGRDPLPPAARRPPPADGFTTAVGAVDPGTSAPVAYDAPCALLDGIRIAGTAGDQAQLRRGLATLCNTALRDDAATAIAAFARAGGVVRFATFEATGVDSTAALPPAAPVVLVNTRFQRTDPAWIAPLVAHDATVLAGDPGTVETAVTARTVEADVCTRLLGSDAGSRACADAAAVLELDRPRDALRDAGYR